MQDEDRLHCHDTWDIKECDNWKMYGKIEEYRTFSEDLKVDNTRLLQIRRIAEVGRTLDRPLERSPL